MGLSTRAASIGDNDSATNADTATEPQTATANSMKSRPVAPLRKASGRNTTMSESVMVMTAKAISSMPFFAASMGDIPASICR